MPSPQERLSAILSAFTSPKVVFSPVPLDSGLTRTNTLVFESTVSTPSEITSLSNDVDLQYACNAEIKFLYNRHTCKYEFNENVVGLWNSILIKINNEYYSVSSRCEATKRKTCNFITQIRIENVNLANFILQVFSIMGADSYQNKTNSEKEELFEKFESLRRTYGKRK